jgi:ATP-dependent RNA circularization protein (DNA/RNA ligase family)
MNAFFKFPSTPYLIASSSQLLRSDKLLTESEKDIFLSYSIIVEEKIDGANLGISFDEEGNLKLQNRGAYLSKPYLGQWKKLEEWLFLHENRLFDMLGSRLILFGEWCYASHSLRYERLPDWFIAFDVYDKKEKKFFSTKRRNRYLQKSDIPIVPKIAEGQFALDSLRDFLKKNSLFSNEKLEGIYLRYEDDKWLKKRAKIVRSEFIQNIDEHWINKPLEVNSLEYWI